MRNYLIGAALAACVTIAGTALAFDDVRGGIGFGEGDARYLKLAGGGALTGSMTAATGNETIFTGVTSTNKASSGNDTVVQWTHTDTASPGTSRVFSLINPAYGSEVFGISPGSGSVKSVIYAGTVELSTSAGSIDIRPNLFLANQAFYIGAGASNKIVDIRTSPFAIGDGTYVTAVGGLTLGTGSLLTEGPTEHQGPTYFAHKTSDPCTGGTPWKPGAFFWNATAKELCYCDGSSADLRAKDSSTACF